MKKSSKPKTNNKLQSRVMIVIIPILALLLIGSMVYRQYSLNRERDQFKQAETYVAQLADQIQAKVGKADQVKQENTCDRPNLKYAKGPLSCSVNYYLLFSKVDRMQATEIMNKIRLQLGGEQLTLLGKPVTEFQPEELQRGRQNIFQKHKFIAELSCGIQYSYPFSGTVFDVFQLSDTQNLQVSLGCSGAAKNEYFPMRD